MLGRRSQLAHFQSDFYREKFRKTLKQLMRMMIVIYILIAIMTFKILVQPKQSYYINTTEGKILPMPSSSP